MPGRDGTGPRGMGRGCCGAGWGQGLGQGNGGRRRGLGGCLTMPAENAEIAALRKEAAELKAMLANIESRLSDASNPNNG